MQSQRKKGPLRAAGINLLLCVTSVSIFFGGAEFLARLQYTPQKYKSEGIFEYDKEKVFRLKANQHTMYFNVPITTNSFGHRGKEIPMAKPKNTKRILMIGDSVTFGNDVMDNETFSHRLEEMLNQHYSRLEDGPVIEVINTAVPGNAPFQEYHDLKRGVKFEPDVVVMQFTLNDIMESDGIWVMREVGMEDVSNEEVWYYDYLFGKDDMSHIDYLLRQHSAFYLFLKDMYDRGRFRDISRNNIRGWATQMERVEADKILGNPQDPEVVESWNNALVWLDRINNLAQENDMEFIMLVSPYYSQFGRGGKSEYPQRILERFSKDRGIEFVDLLAILENKFAEAANGGSEKMADEIYQENPEILESYWNGLFFDYCHPRPIGHELIAEILQPIILKMLSSSKM